MVDDLIWPGEFRLSGDADAPNLLLFAHGAGAGMDHEFMAQMADAIAGPEIQVIRFEFPYMVKVRQLNKRRPPDRLPKLQACFKQWIEVALGRGKRVFVGGKSMGGRVATCCGTNPALAGVLALGYPFHPVGKLAADKWRWQPVHECLIPQLIIQGERDTFGSRAELASHTLPTGAQLHFLDDGDHSFKPRVRSGATLQDNMAQAVILARSFILT